MEDCHKLFTANTSANFREQHHSFSTFEQSLPLPLNPPLSQCLISVVIPVRDEARNLPLTLRALTRQIDFDNRKLDPRSYEIIVFANNCCDESAAVVRQWQRQMNLPPLHLVEISLPPSEANVGRARKLAMETAFKRLLTFKDQRRIIATTDGDTQVAPDWIAAMLYEFKRGADAVSGRILIESAELASLDSKTRDYHLRDAAYRLSAAELESYLAPTPFDPHPRHHQHFNASFAVTLKAYDCSGGVPDVPYLEDFAFYNALLRIDARFRHSPLVRVHTSARRSGRTACGLSTQLAEWSQMGAKSESYLVEGLPALETRFAARRKLRSLWQNVKAENFRNFDQTEILAETFGVSESWLRREIVLSQTFGLLNEKVEQEKQVAGLWSNRFPLIPIERATADLNLRLGELRRND